MVFQSPLGYFTYFKMLQDISAQVLYFTSCPHLASHIRSHIGSHPFLLEEVFDRNLYKIPYGFSHRFLCDHIHMYLLYTQREILGFTEQSFFVKIVFTKMLKFS